MERTINLLNKQKNGNKNKKREKNIVKDWVTNIHN